MKFYIFNVENSDQIKLGAKPHVREIGPFAYRETREKQVIGRNGDEIQYGLKGFYRV